MTGRERTQAQLLVIAELSLASMSVASVLALRRVFEDGTFLPSAIAAVLVAHLIAAFLRRRKVPHATAIFATAAASILFVTWVRLRDTATLGLLPSPDTLSVGRLQIREAIDVFSEVTPPAPVMPGFVILACFGAWMVAFASDTAAFRARAHLEAIIPGATLFIFGGALGTGGNRLGVAALFIGSALLHWLAQRALAATSAPAWLATERGSGARPLLRLGSALVALVVLAAVVIGPHLPGAQAKAIVPWRAADREAPDSRVTVSPLVDIQTRLVEQSDVIVFRVKATERAYWRLTSLEEFNGQQWTSNGQYRPAIGRLGSDVDTSAARFRMMQASFSIEALSQFWLPSPFRPVRLDGASARYDTDSNSLLTEEETATDQEYDVTAAVPVLTDEQLAQVAPIAPRPVVAEYMQLPQGFSPAVQQEAGRAVRGAETQYQKALALQNYFRSDAFTYDLTVDRDHDEDALERFLFQTRRGYCEQFAAAYAVMARVVGLPARVAVGFTPGELDPETGEYVVRGYNAHAWPEVYLDGYGWVAFEPTPGRGMPGAQEYTGIPEAQAQSGDPSTATTVPAQGSAPLDTTTTTAAPPVAPPAVPSVEDDSGLPWIRPLLMVLAILVGVPLLWIAGLAARRVLHRRRRRHGATTAPARVLVAWDEATEALARAGAPPNPWETASEFASRAAGATGIDRRPLLGLAGLTTQVIYGTDEIPDDVAEQAVAVARTVEEETGQLRDGRTRLRLLLDPRPPVRTHREHVEVTNS
jgi:transglutaminase-like putative cysteine protease